MKDLTIIHSFVDRSSIVLVRIPLKTARLSSLFSALLPIWVYLSCSSEPLPLICSTPRQRSQTGTRTAFKLQYRITTQIFTFSDFLCFILSFLSAGFFLKSWKNSSFHPFSESLPYKPYQELLSRNNIVDYRFCQNFKSVSKQLIASFLTPKTKIC